MEPWRAALCTPFFPLPSSSPPHPLSLYPSLLIAPTISSRLIVVILNSSLAEVIVTWPRAYSAWFCFSQCRDEQNLFAETYKWLSQWKHWSAYIDYNWCVLPCRKCFLIAFVTYTGTCDLSIKVELSACSTSNLCSDYMPQELHGSAGTVLSLCVLLRWKCGTSLWCIVPFPCLCRRDPLPIQSETLQCPGTRVNIRLQIAFPNYKSTP